MHSVTYFNGTVYITGNDQVASAYSVVDDQLMLSSQSTNTFGYAGADPTISANGVSNGIAWELDYGTNQLFAYNASNLADELWASNEAPNNRDQLPSSLHEFNAPTVANGMVYVAVDGHLVAYGLLYPQPSAVTTLTPTVAGANQINLSWTNPSTTQTGIEIQRSPDGTISRRSPRSPLPGNTYQDKSVAANTTYFYQVVATNQGVVSGPSNEVSATTTATSGTAPSAPSGLKATAVAGAAGLLPQVNLSWTDNNPGNETAFLIERSVNGGPYALLEQVPATQTTYSDLNLSPGAYSYVVISTNAAGNSSPSAGANAPVPTTPTTPSQGQAAAMSSTEIELSWQNNAANAAGIRIFRRAGVAGDYTLIATLPSTATTYQDTGLTPGTLYYYHIEAFNISGHGGLSGVSATTTSTTAASLIDADTTTEGNWQGCYGSDGYNVIGASAGSTYPTYAQVTTISTSTYVWSTSSTSTSNLENPSGTGRIAAAWYGALLPGRCQSRGRPSAYAEPLPRRSVRWGTKRTY